MKLTCKKKIWLFFFALFFSLNCFPFEKKEILLLYVGYEHQKINAGSLGLNAGITANDSIVIDCQNARKGNCSVKSQVKNSSEYLAFGALRSETDASKVPGVIYKSGDHYRYRFSLMLDRDWDLSDPDSLDSIWQFKRFSSGPDMFLGVKNNSIAWRITERDQITILKPLVKGRWIDFDFDIKWSNSDDGSSRLKVTIDGEPSQEYFFNGRNMRNADSKNGTIHWGLYKPGSRESFSFTNHSVNHDEIFIYRIND